jgi:hypothetical protein
MASPNWVDAVYDGGLNFFTAGTATRVIVCGTEPTNYTQAATTYKLAEYTLVGGDFTKAAGDVSGRKVILGAKSGAVATGTGTGSFLAFTNGTDTLYGVIDGDGDAITTGQTVNIAATDVLEIRAAVDG